MVLGIEILLGFAGFAACVYGIHRLMMKYSSWRTKG